MLMSSNNLNSEYTNILTINIFNILANILNNIFNSFRKPKILHFHFL